MLPIGKIDHIGIRVRDRDRAVKFYELLGFSIVSEGVFLRGQPIIMGHPGGVMINVLGPAHEDGPNVLQDIPQKHAGFTHIALSIPSLENAISFFATHSIEIAEHMSYGNLRAIFIRDPDGNVLEFDDRIDS